MQKKEYLYKGPNHAANLNDMRLKDKWCDVIIKVDGTEIRAHKVILAANLKYFETMFSSSFFQESQNGLITMESVEKADFESFVSYAYTGEILLTDSNALNLLVLANYLDVDEIKKACIDFLEKNLKVEEACLAYKFASAIECLSLKNKAKEMILSNFDNCSKSAEYLSFDFENLMGVLSDGKAYSIDKQKMLFEGIARWIVHDAEGRKVRLEDLLSSVDLTRFKAGEVTSCIYKNVVHHNDESEITKDVMTYYKTMILKRKEEERVLIMIDKTGFFQFYNFIERDWSSRSHILCAMVHTHQFSTVLNDNLFYISNSSGEIHLQVLNPLSKQITSLYSWSSISENASLCACSKFLYICGGVKKDKSRSDQILKYDPETNSFETLTPMGTKRSSAVSIFYQESLYVLGGNDGLSILNTVEKYDPVKKKWTTLTSMRKKRHGHAVAILDGKLYACGGYSDKSYESSTEVYDSATNSWQLVANMNKTRCHFLMVAHEGKLLAIGGVGEKNAEVYYPSEDRWCMDHQMSSNSKIDCGVGGLILASSMTNT